MEFPGVCDYGIPPVPPTLLFFHGIIAGNPNQIIHYIVSNNQHFEVQHRVLLIQLNNLKQSHVSVKIPAHWL